MQRALGIGLAAVLYAARLAGAQSDGTLSFSDSRWSFVGDSVRVVMRDGREALQLKSGFAYRRDVALEDGTVDMDVMTTRRRSFVYVMFRMQSDSTYEDFYLRPHKSELPDALQYAPVYQQQSAWQLYHGDDGTAAPAIEPGVWNHLRIVLQGRQAAFFLGDTVKPVLVVSRLGHAPIAGYFALRAFLPPGTPGSGPIATISRLRIRANHVPFTFPAPRTVPALTGLVRAWNIGAAFAAPDTPITAYPPASVAQLRRVETLPKGLLELHRVVPITAAMRNAGVVARLDVIADSTAVYPMDLGFSDNVTVLLNGKPLFHRDDFYDFAGRRDGLIGLGQARVYLPLNRGRNELALIVTDRFGGWGLMGRFPSMQGLRVEP
jgi:hypothetical protein